MVYEEAKKKKKTPQKRADKRKIAIKRDVNVRTDRMKSTKWQKVGK